MIIVYQYVQYMVYYLPVIAFCTTEFVCYDDGCHLKKYSQNPSRSSATETTKLLASLSIVVDKMHMKGIPIHGARSTVTHGSSQS